VREAENSGKSVGIFHYGSHEVSWWRRFARNNEGVSGVPSIDEVDTFISKYFVNLLPLAQKVAFKSSGYSIKDLAPLAGFQWRVDDPGGALSLLKYRTATTESANDLERKEAKEWLRSYNADDVRATLAVRQFLRSLQL
jgi:predicted RecB family nuclease